ncbi:hypothetical protein D9M71_679260 [compost metagenome]
MGARLAVEQADFTEPVRRFDQRQQRLLAFAADRPDAHAARQHRVQTAGRIAALEQVLPRRQLAKARQARQAILKGQG